SVAQWFPRMCVYDDIKGWNVEPYLGSGEFYLEYGNIDYKITTSNKLVILGCGALQNATACYTPEQVSRWEKARNSDTKVEIIAEKEVTTTASRPVGTNGKITWHFKIENTRDAAFGSSEEFIVDACRINLPSGKKSLAISGYPKESVGADKDNASGWERSTEYSKAAIEFYSKWLFEFPYATANNCASIAGGMEYPGLNFCSYKSKGEGLWGVTDHEFGHNWFPMIVGTNERLYPWMDEGFNTFINHYSTMAFNNKEYYNPAGFTIANLRNAQIQGYAIKFPNREPISTYPDVVQDFYLGVTAYFKPGMGLWLLREYVLGEERFDFAFKTYIKRWAFKHPQPADFFNCMENAAGEELDWFWKAWFYGTGTFDQAVESVKYVKDDPANGSIITIKNIGEVILPVVVDVVEENGKTTRVNLPVEIWQKGNSKDFKVATTGKVKEVKLDPERKLPDVDGKNDMWNADDEAKKKAETEAKKKTDEEAKKATDESQQPAKPDKNSKKKKTTS
ncbi:MAG: M1 family metallopeptidase, partial [Verrucomicrobia bacterium]|nr:M1 family metallopeptidase [Cytophagales bacterium]